MENKKDKNLTVETLRGAVIILVVIGHVIGSGSEGGMKVADDSFWRYFYFTFADFLQMPLFTVIAGWVYALRPVTLDKAADFMKKKFMRIMIPMFLVGICYFLLQYMTPGTNRKGNLSEIWRLVFFPYTLFWYLYSLFLVFGIVTFIDSLKKMNTFTNWLIVLFITLSILVVRDMIIPFESPNYLSYKGALYLLPCFILGIGIKRYSDFFQNLIFNTITLIVLVISVIIQQLSWFKVIDYPLDKSTGVGLLIGITGTILLFRLRPQYKWLVWVGSFAYSIYLFHAFGTAGGRIITQKFGIHMDVLVFAISLIAGLSLPILAETILKRFKLTRILFLGQA